MAKDYSKPKSKKVKQADKTYESNAAMWKARYDAAQSHQEQMFSRFKKFYQIMYAQFNTDNMAPWRSKVYLPMLASKGWDIITKFLALKPGFEVNVRDDTMEDDDDIKERAEKQQKKLLMDYDNPNLEKPIREKLIDVLYDSVVTGTGVAKVPYVSKKMEQRAHPILDEETGEVDLTQDIVKENITGFNDLIPVNIFNFYISPAATSMQNAQWVIIREFKTVDELKKARDENFIPYTNLDELQGAQATADQMSQYNAARNPVLGKQEKVEADDTIDYIEIFECYDKANNKICTFAGQGSGKGKGKGEYWVEIRNQENPYWHGKFPLVTFYTKKRPYEFWGESIFESTERIQSAVNDIFNHYMDNWNLSVNGMVMMEETSYVSDYIIEPGGELFYKNTEPKQFKYPEPNPQQLSEIMKVLERSFEEATISQYAAGTPQSSTDKTQGTATGIIRLQEAANEKIGFMKANFQQALKEVGQMWLSNNQQFMDEPVVTDITRGNSVEKLVITPADMQGVSELRIDDASMEPATKEMQQQAHLAWVQHMLQLQQASWQQYQLTQNPEDMMRLDFNAIGKESSIKFNKKDVGKYVLPYQPPPQPEQGSEAIVQALSGQGGQPQ